MTRRLLFPTLALVALVSASEAVAQPLRVFVAAADGPAPVSPTEADRVEASAAYTAADTARKALEKTLKAQYGNKRDKWPAESQEQMIDAEQARDRLNSEWLYRRDGRTVIPGWAGLIRRALTSSGRTGRKEHVTPVATADDAHLIVTVTGLRHPTPPLRDPQRPTRGPEDALQPFRLGLSEGCLMIRLASGPGVSAASIAAVPRTYRPGRFQSLRLAVPDDRSPYWRFEGCAVPPYYLVNEAIANIVNDFAGAHRSLLTGSATQ